MTLDVHVVAQCKNDGLDLRRKFPRGREDECLRLSDSDVDGLEHGDGECGGFTGARLGLSDDIPALCYGEYGTLLYC